MSQPWTKVAESEVIWDNDINPEGIAVQYSRKFGDTNVFGSGGAFTLKDNVTGFGPEFNNDLRMYYGTTRREPVSGRRLQGDGRRAACSITTRTVRRSHHDPERRTRT